MKYNDFRNNKCRNISFIIRKIDSITGIGIPGAVFELSSCNSFTCGGITDSNGLLLFCLSPCSTYMLIEVETPAGYMPINRVYNIHVDACGCIFVDGVPTSDLVIPNTPLLLTASFTAIKVDINTGLPLTGAVYTLYMNSSQIASTTSNVAGQLTFTNLTPGTYNLVETTPPTGFQTNNEPLTVVVTQDGNVTINGQQADGFIINDTPIAMSEPPAINTILEGDSSITGIGIPGSEIVVTFQNGATVTTIVNTSGIWIVNVPPGVELVPEDVVSAIQTEPGKLPSHEVISIVIGRIEPFLDKNVENLSSPGGPIEPGDSLLFTVHIGNLGGAGSVWNNAVLTDFIIEKLTLLQGTVTIDGELIPAGTGIGHYNYDSVARTLTIYVGDINSGQVKTVTFQATVNPDATGEIVNSVTATSLFTPRLIITAISPTVIINE